MEFLIVWISAAAAAALTLPSGFGLGTVLMPVFALFFPLDLAIAMTAVVHLFTNLFKFGLFGRSADTGILARFGIPAILGAFVGARALLALSGLQPLFSYTLLGRTFSVMPVKAVIAVLLITFVLLDLIPRVGRIFLSKNLLIGAGAITGFFGGLSGQQGALRSSFLIGAGLSKETFIATGTAIGCLVDFSRISVYSAYFAAEGFRANGVMLAGAVLAAFLGTALAARMIKEVSMQAVRIATAIMLVAIACALAAGFV